MARNFVTALCSAAGGRRAEGFLGSFTRLMILTAALATIVSGCGGSTGEFTTPTKTAPSAVDIALDKGGSHSLGLQDVVGAAKAGDCVGELVPGAQPPTYYFCGPYAKQWCKDHPGKEPASGSCDGVPGWSTSSGKASVGAGGAGNTGTGNSGGGGTVGTGGGAVGTGGGTIGGGNTGSGNTGSGNTGVGTTGGGTTGGGTTGGGNTGSGNTGSGTTGGGTTGGGSTGGGTTGGGTT